MKMLNCEICGDIIAPLRANNVARWCVCGRHAVWWVDGQRGILRVHDHQSPFADGRPADPAYARAYVLGVNNDFLMYPYPHDAESVRMINERCPDSYLFKKWGTPFIRIRPGESNDTDWAPLPKLER